MWVFHGEHKKMLAIGNSGFDWVLPMYLTKGKLIIYFSALGTDMRQVGVN